MSKVEIRAAATFAVVLVMATAAPCPADAGPGGNIELSSFRPAVDSRGFITVNGASVLGPGDLSLGLMTTWGKGLLELEDGDNHYEVQHILVPTLSAAVGFRLGPLAFEAGAALPFGIMAGDRDPDSMPADNPNQRSAFRFRGQGLGDASLHLKWNAFDLGEPRRGFGAALLLAATLPTSTGDGLWLGENQVRLRAALLLEARVGRLRAAVNGGIHVRTDGVQTFTDDNPLMVNGAVSTVTGKSISVGTTLPFSAALSFAIAPQRFELVGEVLGEIPLEGDDYLPLEALAGARLYLAQSSYLSLGGGGGLLRDRAGNPDVRVFLGIVFEPKFEPPARGTMPGNELTLRSNCEPELSTLGPECPTLDDDGDLIPNQDDWCPKQPEDKDGYEDHDGCPDPDNDADLVADKLDSCPGKDAEPRDQTQETYNGVRDEDGCPDGESIIEPDSDAVVLHEIYFEYDSAIIKQESHGILKTVASALRVHTDIERVEVQGHTDERGTRPYNQDLSQRRAQAVVDFLIEQGVEATRLTAAGYGEDQPIDPSHSEEAYAQNRRVEFVIK